MTNENPVRFTLDNNTEVVVKKVTDDKYDFNLLLANGSRKTFVWSIDMPVYHTDKKGNLDVLVTQAIQTLQAIIKNSR